MPKRVPVSAHFIDEYTPVTVTQDGQPQPMTKAGVTYDMMYDWFLKSNELMGIVTAIADDIVGEGYDLISDSPELKESVSVFLEKEQFISVLYSIIIDMLITGNGYLGIGKIDEKELSVALCEAIDELNIQKSEVKSTKVLISLKQSRPDLFGPQYLFPIKSLSMKINYDANGRVIDYVQKPLLVSQSVSFAPEEIVHFTYLKIGGSVYGYSPFVSCLDDAASVWYAKNYAGQFFGSDAIPDLFFILEDSAPNSEEFRQFKDQLTNRKKKRGHAVFTGKLRIERVNQFNKDLEFATLIDSFTTHLLVAWNMPPTRVGIIPSNYKAGIEGTEGYYKKIGFLQTQVEGLLNYRLFNQFGKIKIQFKKAYKRDESREADIVTKLVGRPVLTIDEGRDYLGKLPTGLPEHQQVGSGFMPSNPTGTQNTGGSSVNPAENLVDDASNKIEKSMKFDVSLDDLVRIVEHTGVTFKLSKRFYFEDANAIEIYFSDEQNTYRAVTRKSEIEDMEQFRFTYLRFAIKLLEQPRVDMKLRVVN